MDINKIQRYMSVSPSLSTGRAARPVAESAASSAAAAETRADKVDLSSQASFKAQLGAYAKIYAAEASKPASPARINQLKQQYQGDTCPASGTDIASAVLKYTLGGALCVD